jgi:hypothetical protein
MADLLAEQGAIEGPLADDPHARADSPGPASAPASPAPLAAAVPEPRAEAGDGPLSAGEQSDLSTCEAALDNLRMAFWAAGKALQTVRDGRLYRSGYATFEDYVEQRWDMSRAQAYRLIEAWPLAERLSPIGDTITESQVRELLPVAGRHGTAAAAVVYETVAEADGVRVTAAVLHQVVGILPADDFDRDEAIAQIRAYLAGELPPPEPPAVDRGQVAAAQATRLLTALHRAARTDPGAVRKAVAELRAALDEIEREITA